MKIIWIHIPFFTTYSFSSFFDFQMSKVSKVCWFFIHHLHLFCRKSSCRTLEMWRKLCFPIVYGDFHTQTYWKIFKKHLTFWFKKFSASLGVRVIVALELQWCVLRFLISGKWGSAIWICDLRMSPYLYPQETSSLTIPPGRIPRILYPRGCLSRT